MKHLDVFVRNWLKLALLFALCSCGGGSSDSATKNANDAVTAANRSVPDNVFTAALSAAQQVPPNASTATGIGVVMLDPASRLIRATLTTAGISGSSAQIQLAPAGTAGAIVFPMAQTPAGSGIWSAQTTLTDEQITALRNGNYYFSVRSAAFPEGEIRGQIAPQLPVSVATSSFEGGTGGGIDTGAANEGSFSEGSAANTTPANIAGSGVPSGSTTGTTVGPAGLDSGTGGTGGAISPSNGNRRVTFVNVLTGSQQVPPSGSGAIAIGVAIVDAASQTVVASITSLGISGIGAHVHRAAAGSNGDTVFALNETSAGSGIWGDRLVLTPAQLDALSSGNHYFDIHSAAFPNGELRGQIAAAGSSGKFVIGSGDPDIPVTGTSPGASPTPFVTDTGSSTDLDGASVPTFGNPAGSGIGGAGSGFTGTNNPSFGNPAGSGIGGSTAPNGFNTTPSATPAGSGIGSASGIGSFGSTF